MSQAKHTPGPWHVECNFYVYDANRHAVASSSAGSTSKAKANAALIAAAPNLLTSLLDMLFMHSILDENRICDCKACEAARASIAKSKGE